MKLSWGFGLVGATFVVAGALSCSSDRRSESIAHSSQALSVTDRVLSFEQAHTDWTPVDGAIVSNDLHVDGAHSGAFTVTGWNAQLVSPKLAPLGPIGSTATLELELPANLNGQSWQGQISLAVDAPSAGVYSQHTNAVQFQSAPVGSFQHIQFTLAPAVVSALSAATAADLQFTLIFGMTPNTQPFLVDKLNFGQTSQPDGGTDAGSMTGSGASTGTGGSAGAGGASGGTSTGGGGAAGSAGASGGAAAGSGGMSGGAAVAGTVGGGTTTGASGPCDFNAPSSDTSATNINFTIKLPHGVHREDVAIATENGGFFRLDDGVRVVKDTGGFASVSSLESIIRPELGVSAEAQDLYSEPTGIDLRSNAHVHGIVKTAANLTKQAGAIVDGSVSENTSLQPFDTIDWTEAFPDINRGSCSLEPDNTEIIDPGSYGAIAIKSRSHLKIRSGKYYFASLSFEPESVLDIDNTAGPVFIYVRTDFAFSGTVLEADPTHMNFLFGVAGANDISIQSPFRGILVAPLAGVNLATEGALGHVGSFFMRAVIAHQNTLIHQRPFLPSEFCASDAACSSFCPCDSGMRTCTADSQCKTGLVCGLGNGRRFDQPGGSNVCWDPRCNAVPATLACGAPTSACGRCTDAPPTCADDSDCASGEVCGLQNSGRFGEAAGANVCWPAICSTQPNSPGNCGSTSAACGTCDCSATCAAKHCGDDPADGCGGFCPGLCGPGQAGCKSDLDCAAGTVCGQGVGDRFGLPVGSNVCWASACALQDPSKPNCGVGSAQCGACPVCVPQCSAGSTGPDGCGGFCGECAGLRFHGLCINQSLVDNEPFPVLLPPAEPTQLVGTLPGSFQVTDRGTASYSIPIAVPPGRMGMEPDLSLRYSSTKANGMLGMGWSLGGLSSITRCPSILDREGATQPVKLDATDHFCLDGQSLVQISNSTLAYGDDGAEYRTEIDSFRKITAHRTGSVLAAGAMLHGPDSFEVRTKDGRILTYGGTDDSVAVPDISPPVGRVWALSKVSDRSGNTMQISYIANRAIGIGDAAVQHDGIEINLPGGTPDGTVELVPKLISYGEVSGSPSRFVAFDYEARPDVQKHFSAGVAGYSTQRLTAIETLVGGPARIYHIDYEADRPDLESRVKAIRECSPSANGEVCMPATQFSYSEFHDPVAVPALGSLQIQTGRSGTLQHCLDLAGGVRTIKDPNGALALKECFVDFAPVLRPSIITGDFNGDALDDVLGDASVDGLPESYANGLWTLALSRGDGTFAVTSSPDLVGGMNPTNRCISQDSVMDVNRDGMADLVYLCVDAGVGSGTFPRPSSSRPAPDLHVRISAFRRVFRGSKLAMSMGTDSETSWLVTTFRSVKGPRRANELHFQRGPKYPIGHPSQREQRFGSGQLRQSFAHRHRQRWG